MDFMKKRGKRQCRQKMFVPTCLKYAANMEKMSHAGPMRDVFFIAWGLFLHIKRSKMVTVVSALRTS